MNINVVELTSSWPKASMLVRRVRAAFTGRPYFFNRQRMRRRVFDAINDKVSFTSYIETGTYLGKTTYFLAATARKRGAKVYSCEINPDFFAVASRTVGDLDNVLLHRANSVDFLRALPSAIPQGANFVYLDAHWYDYLPLRDELAILTTWPDTIVMIDDFKVPHDKGFRWDYSDAEREICLEHIAESIGDRPVYFPSYAARVEGEGIAVGYCVIAMSSSLERVLDGIDLLRKFER